MPKRDATKKANTTGAKKHLGRRTVKSSNRIRAQRANQSDKVLPGKRDKARQYSRVIDADSDEEVFGVLLSERRRMGESYPTVPEKKTKTTPKRKRS